MLFFTRWKAAAIVLTALVVCLFAVPNFFPDRVVKSWPNWAQRHIVLGLDLQGGSSILLQVDTNAVRKEQLQTIYEDVLRVLREARIPFTGRAIRGNGVEVHITRDTDIDNALAKLRGLSQPMSGILASTGQRTLDVSNNGNTVTLTPSDPAVIERVRQAVDQSIEIVQRRVNGLGLVEPTIQREGTDRILVQVPGLKDPKELLDILGKTAKLDFRMVDLTMTPEQATRRPSGGFGNLCRGEERPVLSDRKARAGVGRRSHQCAAGLRPADRPADVTFTFNSVGCAQIRRGHHGTMSASRSPSSSTTR